MTVIRPMSTPGEQRCARGRGPPCSGFAVEGRVFATHSAGARCTGGCLPRRAVVRCRSGPSVAPDGLLRGAGQHRSSELRLSGTRRGGDRGHQPEPRRVPRSPRARVGRPRPSVGDAAVARVWFAVGATHRRAGRPGGRRLRRLLQSKPIPPVVRPSRSRAARSGRVVLRRIGMSPRSHPTGDRPDMGGGLDRSVQAALLRADVGFLQQQLKNESIAAQPAGRTGGLPAAVGRVTLRTNDEAGDLGSQWHSAQQRHGLRRRVGPSGSSAVDETC